MQEIEIETQCEDPGSRGQQPGDLEGGGEGRAVVVEADVGEGPEDEDHHRHHQQRGHGGVVPNLTHSHNNNGEKTGQSYCSRLIRALELETKVHPKVRNHREDPY